MVLAWGTSRETWKAVSVSGRQVPGRALPVSRGSGCPAPSSSPAEHPGLAGRPRAGSPTGASWPESAGRRKGPRFFPPSSPSGRLRLRLGLHLPEGSKCSCCGLGGPGQKGQPMADKASSPPRQEPGARRGGGESRGCRCHYPSLEPLLHPSCTLTAIPTPREPGEAKRKDMGTAEEPRPRLCHLRLGGRVPRKGLAPDTPLPSPRPGSAASPQGCCRQAGLTAGGRDSAPEQEDHCSQGWWLLSSFVWQTVCRALS